MSKARTEGADIKEETVMEPVTLTVSGNACTISNGILSMSWKEDGTLGVISRKGVELVRNLPECSDTQGKPAIYVDYHAEGTFYEFESPKLKVIEVNEQMVHVAYLEAAAYLKIEFHIILMQGESGFYSYVIGENNVETPFELAEFRIVYRCGSRIFDHAYNCERHGLQPAHIYMEQFEKLQDETYRLPDGERYTNGEVYSKYDYAGYFSQNPVWGQYGHGYGFFVIPASTEYYPGGPLKQELLVHYDGIVLNYLTGAHFGNGTLHVPIGWKKLYGPVYQYINEGEDAGELIADAHRVALAQQAKWPYQWVKEPLYPLVRSHVKGRILTVDGTPCSHTTVILGQKELPIELQSADYIYYTETDEDGRFALENVRFGTYTLWAYQTGGSNTERLKLPDIKITQEEQQLPDLIWHLPRERVLWQLGKATRTCEGYRYAGELRNYKWMTLVPQTLHFYIGQSKEEQDWYYAQPNNGSWYIHFSFESIPENAYLILAIAGASRENTDSRKVPNLTASVNGQSILETAVVNDGAIYRSATKNGRYHRFKIAVDPAALRIGENQVELSVKKGMIMYDTVLMTCEE